MTTTDSNATAISEHPFAVKVCLEPLLEAWRADAGCHPMVSSFCKEINDLKKNRPELFEPTSDLTRFADARDLVKLILSPLISCSTGPYNLVAVAKPFAFECIYVTEQFEARLLDANGALKARPKNNTTMLSTGRQLAIYVQIAKQCLGLELGFEANPTFVVEDEDDGLHRYYQFHFDCQFLRVNWRGKARKLAEEKLAELRQNLRDLDLWKKTLPPEQFELHGVVLIHAVDITARECISQMQLAFTAGTQLVSKEGIALLTESSRDLLRQPELNIRLLSAQGNRIFMVNSDANGHAGCLVSNSQHFDKSDFTGSIYAQAQESDFVFVGDCQQELNPELAMHQALLVDGVKSLLIFPVREDGTLIGMLEFDFPSAGIDPADVALRVGDLLAIVTLGLKQGRQFLEQSIRTVIQNKCSVVHPAVDWRFRQAALEMISDDHADELEPIVFREVHPLYSQADIKDSSKFRNSAIQADLTAQLQLAHTVLTRAIAQRPMPLLEEMAFQIEGYLSSLEGGLRSGDELSMSGFFKTELEPVFNQLTLLGDDVRDAIDAYHARLEPQYGMLHERRSEYEQSVQRLNDSIAQFLADEEPRAQAMYPHYFEKTFTDGAEMMIYVGASLVEDGNFDPFYLRNLRLWQLRVSCQIARLCTGLLDVLPLPLETTHLILVQDAPLSIRFSETERDFIVDGAYNIRYEIMKKRIDKALVKNETERLTQPGKIAIVYSHNKEAAEYQRYIRYLQHQGWLADDVEDLELQALQGLQGLRALRVTVTTAADGSPKSVANTLPGDRIGAEDRNIAQEVMGGAIHLPN